MWLSSAQIVAFLLLLIETYCYAAEDYYKTLGLKDTASIPEVKKAFRTLAKTLHPDKNKEPGAETKFRKVLEAYEVLSDEDKKREYDAMRRGGGGSRSGSNFNSFGRGTRARNFDFDFDELFKQVGTLTCLQVETSKTTNLRIGLNMYVTYWKARLHT